MFQDFFQELSSGLGVPVDQLRYVACIFLTYPTSLFYIKAIPQNSHFLKHVFSIVCTLFLFLFVHDQFLGFCHLALSCLVTYGILSKVKGSLGPKLIFVWAMGHMAYTHLYRQIYHYGDTKMDFSGPQMVWTIKLTMFAFNVYDGQVPEIQLSPYQLSRRITKLPSFIEFLGYILYSGGFFVGPAFEYTDYIRFVRSDPFRNAKTGEIDVPSTIIPAIKCMLTGLICAVIPIFVYQKVALPTLVTPGFAHQSFFARLFWIYVACTAERFKYYFAWLLAEGACVLSGLGYCGKDKQGRHLWGAVTNVNILKVELAENFRMVMENWNIGTNLWLRNYVYLRIAPVGSKSTFGAQIATFATSAFWHGFYPGYYMTFLFGGIVNEQARFLRRCLRPWIVAAGSPALKRLYDIVGWLVTAMCLNYVVIPFVLLNFKDSFYLYSKVHFCVHLGTLVMMLINQFRLLSPPRANISKANPVVSEDPLKKTI
ncbi:Lysophospholipid acyltransferase [Entomophthora muscae]|uniref:Lysophospholipid acyltransferase n=1 Tax=Entomophthora muscae TaxID=34485 RepID=A0ACC2TPM0_9FUNG|nr:Lysophospholipid acyltransferase [Entomophthora muscae]